MPMLDYVPVWWSVLADVVVQEGNPPPQVLCQPCSGTPGS